MNVSSELVNCAGAEPSSSGVGDEALIDRQREDATAEEVIQGTPRVMGALVVLLQSITLGGMRLQQPAVVLRLGSQVTEMTCSQQCHNICYPRSSWSCELRRVLPQQKIEQKFGHVRSTL